MVAKYKRLHDRVRVLGSMLAIQLLRQPPYPFYVNLVINTTCNLRCAYCFGKYPERSRMNMSYELFTIIVDMLAQQGTKYILLQGGEPFLHNDLGRMIRYVFDKNIIVAIVSNGQLPEKIKDISELDLLDNICFSLDGNKEGNDAVRGRGSFDKVLQSIAEVKSHWTVPIRISSTLHKYVCTDIDFMVHLMRDQHLEWGVNLLFKGDETVSGNLLQPDSKVLIAALEKIILYKKQGCSIFTATKILRYAITWLKSTKKVYLSQTQLKSLKDIKPIHCQYGRYEIVIDEHGFVYPCQGLQGVFEAQSLFVGGFKQAFENLREKPCYSCYIPSLLNTSAMINWDLAVIAESAWDSFRHMVSRR